MNDMPLVTLRDTEALEGAFERIDLKLIDLDPNNTRRTPTTPLEDALFRDDIALRGMLQPINVRPVGERFQLIAGERRVKAARELGWKHIGAMVRQADDSAARGMQAAENAHRVGLHPLDEWAAMVSLQKAGLSLQAAGQCLGLTDRRARQLDRLGRIAPPLLDAMRKHGIPNERDLAQIAEADPSVQARVFKQHTKGAGGRAQWWQIARALHETVIPQAFAIFDLTKAKGVAWQEDVFAEPGSKNAITTANRDAFMKHQQTALVEQVAARAKRKEAIELVNWDDDQRIPAIPEGYEYTYEPVPKSLKAKPEDPRLIVVAIAPTGEVKSILVKKKARKCLRCRPKRPRPVALLTPISIAVMRHRRRPPRPCAA